MKLVLFQTATGSDVTPGLLTERGVVSIADAVSPGATPQLTMQYMGARLHESRGRSAQSAGWGAPGVIATGGAARSLYNVRVPTVPTAVAPARSENNR